MRKEFSNREIENGLKQTISHMTPNVLDSILEQCDEESQKIQNRYPNSWMKNRYQKCLSKAMELVAILTLLTSIILGTSFYQKNYVVASSILVEVNSGVNIIISENKRVLKVEALNEEGTAILKNINVEGKKLEEAIHVIAEEIVKLGYIDAKTTAVVVSVEEDDEARNIDLQVELENNIGAILFQNKIYVEVVSQDLTQDDELRGIVKEYGVSFGKAEMMRKIVNSTYLYTMEELTSLDENQLWGMQSRSYTGRVINKIGTEEIHREEYVGFDYELVEKAYEHAVEQDVMIDKFEIEVRDEYDKNQYYVVLKEKEAEGEIEQFQYTYEIDFTTREIISCKVDTVPVVMDLVKAWSKVRNNTSLIPSDEESCQMIGCTLEKKAGMWVYEMKFFGTKYWGMVELNATTGTVLSFERKERSDFDNQLDNEEEGFCPVY